MANFHQLKKCLKGDLKVISMIFPANFDTGHQTSETSDTSETNIMIQGSVDTTGLVAIPLLSWAEIKISEILYVSCCRLFF